MLFCRPEMDKRGQNYDGRFSIIPHRRYHRCRPDSLSPVRETRPWAMEVAYVPWSKAKLSANLSAHRLLAALLFTA